MILNKQYEWRFMSIICEMNNKKRRQNPNSAAVP